MALLSCIPILKKHFSSLRKDSSIGLILFWFFAIPFIVALILFLLKIFVTRESLNNIINAYAIFVGFLINVVVLLIPLRSNNNIKIKQNLADHLHYNTLYTLIVGLIILTIALFGNFLKIKLPDNIVQFCSFIMFFLIAHFLFNILLIIRRVYALFE